LHSHPLFSRYFFFISCSPIKVLRKSRKRKTQKPESQKTVQILSSTVRTRDEFTTSMESCTNAVARSVQNRHGREQRMKSTFQEFLRILKTIAFVSIPSSRLDTDRRKPSQHDERRSLGRALLSISTLLHTIPLSAQIFGAGPTVSPGETVNGISIPCSLSPGTWPRHIPLSNFPA